MLPVDNWSAGRMRIGGYMRNKNAKIQIFDNTDKHEGAVIRKPGSKKLYVLFYYFNRRIEKSTGLDDSPENQRQVRVWLDRQMEKIGLGKFVFAEAFPSAPNEEKALFAKLEGWEFQPEPKDILFGDYVQQWLVRVRANPRFTAKMVDWQCSIGGWLLPFFEDMTFYQISGPVVKQFIAKMKLKKGPQKGQPLSKKRIKGIFIPTRSLQLGKMTK